MVIREGVFNIIIKCFKRYGVEIIDIFVFEFKVFIKIFMLDYNLCIWFVYIVMGIFRSCIIKKILWKY